jgi:Ala-tRNA(Pro) deacylase
MLCRERLERYLDENGVAYSEERHARAYSTQQIAAMEHVPGDQFAKVVMLVGDGRTVMAVVPASRHVRLERAAEALGAQEVRLANEWEFSSLFPDCEVGAMPPFGNLYDLPVYVDEVLTTQDEIVMQAGTHRDTLRVRYADFERLAHPVVASLTA